MSGTTKKTISHDDYLRLEGLLALAWDHGVALRDIERAAIAITGEEDTGPGDTNAGEAVYDVYGTRPRARELCEKLGLEIEGST